MKMDNLQPYVLDMDELDKATKLRVLSWLKGCPNEHLNENMDKRYLYLFSTGSGYYLFTITSLDLIDDDYSIVPLDDFLNAYYSIYKNKIEYEVELLQDVISLIIDGALK